MTNPPENASEYTFDSKAVKETKFEIDGVFVPPENNSPGVVYFVEVQFQKDEKLYVSAACPERTYDYLRNLIYISTETAMTLAIYRWL